MTKGQALDRANEIYLEHSRALDESQLSDSLTSPDSVFYRHKRLSKSLLRDTVNTVEELVIRNFEPGLLVARRKRDFQIAAVIMVNYSAEIVTATCKYTYRTFDAGTRSEMRAQSLQAYARKLLGRVNLAQFRIDEYRRLLLSVCDEFGIKLDWGYDFDKI